MYAELIHWFNLHSVRKMVLLRHFLGRVNFWRSKKNLGCILVKWLAFFRFIFHFCFSFFSTALLFVILFNSQILTLILISWQPTLMLVYSRLEFSQVDSWVMNDGHVPLFWSWCVERVKHYSRGSKYELVKPNTIPVPISSHFVRFSNGRGSH